MIQSRRKESNFPVFKLNEKNNCSFFGDLIHLIFFLMLFSFFNYGVFIGYKKMTAGWFGKTFPGIEGLVIYMILPFLFNVILIYTNFAFASQLLVYEDCFVICYLLRRKKVYFSELKDAKFKLSVTGKDFEFLYTTSRGKGFCAFYFSSEEYNKGRGAEYVMKQLKEIFKEKMGK